MSQKRAITTFLSRKSMITRLSIAFEDFLGSPIAPQVMPPCKSLNKPSGFCRYEGASGPNRIAINVMEKRLQLPLQEPIKSAEGQTFQKRSNRLFTIESSAISGSLIALQNHQREIPKEKLVLRFSQSFPF